ncbi:ABC transporter permease [Tepidanaerobacter acetatoxydans]|uniref:ABC transporter permease n=1 Tax=Tepidanaerobacter acetatoxydans TaxID=499229 RepID=UPI001BD32E19|nr:ABC transporter permease [Tepidanaerobacter acetatoxydans]
MTLQTLPFNKALLKKDWKMTKWLCFAVAGILFFTMTLGVINTYSNYQRTIQEMEKHPEWYLGFDEDEYKSDLKNLLQDKFKQLSGMEAVLVIFTPMAAAALLFGEEKRKKTFEILATMPFSRTEIFFNKAVIAFVNVILPFLVNAVIMAAALWFSKGLRDFYSAGMVMSWLGADAFRLFVTLSFSLLFASLTGTSISQLVLTIIFFIFPIGFTGLLYMNMAMWGYRMSVIDEFLNIFGTYTMPGILSNVKEVPIAFHLISAIVMLAAAKLLFDRNKLERSGETLEFEAIETFFKFGVAVCTSMLVGVIVTGCVGGFIYFSSNVPRIFTIIGYVIGIFLGWFIASYSIKTNRAKV